MMQRETSWKRYQKTPRPEIGPWSVSYLKSWWHVLSSSICMIKLQGFGIWKEFFTLIDYGILHEKARQMKKAFCFNFCACHILRTNLSTSDLRFVQVTSVEKREPRGTFLSLGLRPRLQKTFPRFPFFYFGNLDKPQIRRGQICPKHVASTKIETKYYL